MGAFDDLIPGNTAVAEKPPENAFADLIPATGANAFADLIPASGSAGQADTQKYEFDRSGNFIPVASIASPQPTTRTHGAVSDFGRRVASETGKQALNTAAGLARFSADLFDQHPILATILTGGTVQLPVPAKRAVADFASEAAQNADSAYGVDPARNNDAASKVAVAAGGLINAVPAVFSGGAGLPLLASQALGGTKEADYQRNIASGDSPEEASRKSELSSAVKTAVTLPLYMVGGKGANMLAEMLPNTSPAVVKLGAQFLTNVGANTAASSAARGVDAAVEGEPIGAAMKDFNLPGAIQDAVFAAHGTVEGARMLRDYNVAARENLQKIPLDHLEALSADPQVRKALPFNPKLLDAEIATRKQSAVADINEKLGNVAVAKALRAKVGATHQKFEQSPLGDGVPADEIKLPEPAVSPKAAAPVPTGEGAKPASPEPVLPTEPASPRPADAVATPLGEGSVVKSVDPDSLTRVIPIQEEVSQELKRSVEKMPDPSKDSDGFNYEKGDVWNVVQRSYLPAFRALGAEWEWHTASTGSMYLKIKIPLDAESLADAHEVENHKITIRDHDVSDLRAREFGAPTKSIQVDAFDSKERMVWAGERLSEHLRKILEPFSDYLEPKKPDPVAKAETVAEPHSPAAEPQTPHTPSDTAPAPAVGGTPEKPVGANLPTLRSGENQGDLLSKQTEDLTLVGEKGTDFAAREAERVAAEKASAEAKAKQDREQQNLFDKPSTPPENGTITNEAAKPGATDSGAVELTPRQQSARIEQIVNDAVNAGKDRIEAENEANRIVDSANAKGVPVNWQMVRDGALGRSTEKRGAGRSESLDAETPSGRERAESVADKGPAADAITAASETMSAIDKAVQALPEGVRDVWNRHPEGQSLREIADEMGVSHETARKHLNEAKSLLQKNLKARGIGATGIVANNPIIEWISKNARRLFTAEGDLPKPVFADWIKREGRVASEAKEVQFAVRDLYQAVAKSFNINKAKSLVEGLSSVPPIIVRQMNAALAGDMKAMGLLSIDVQAAVAKMRQHVDLLSEEMVRKGLVDSELAAVITGNKGSYLTRTYKIFDQGEKWVKDIPADVFNRARTFLHRELLGKNPAATDADADRLLRNMLADWTNEGTSLKQRGGKLGAKDLTSFIKRKDIAPELRAVMGENTNVIHNYAVTASKIARFISDQEFLSAVKNKGLGKFLFENENAPTGFNTIIAAEESATMSPLNGLRTTPEIARAFSEFGKRAGDPGVFLKIFRHLNLLSKGAKTVGSVLTQARNLTGQPFFFALNGHYDMRPLQDAFKAVRADLGLSNDASARALVKDAAAHGLVGENAFAGEFREAFQKAMLFSPEDVPDAFATQFFGTRLVGKTIKGAERLYQISDELGKVVGWFNEQKRVRSMNPGMSDVEVKRTAADRIRLCYPTYSMSPEALKTFRQQPFFGPFATFWYETYRTTFHNIRIGIEDIKGPTPEHKRAGAERLVGTMGVLAVAGYGAQAVTRAMIGMDRKEDEDVRRMLPPWSENAQLAYLGKGGGKYDFVNLSYGNPYSTLSDPAIGVFSSLSRGEDADQAFGRGLSEVFAPLSNEQIATAALVDVMRNKTQTGGQVFNPQAPWEVKGPQILKHLGTAIFMPGTVDRLGKRIIPAIQGKATAYGRTFNPAKEISAELTGVRFESMSMGQALQFKAKRFVGDENDAESIFRSVATRGGTASTDEIVDAYKTSEESRFNLWQELHRDFMAARRSGVSVFDAKSAMRSRRISSATVDAVTSGRYVPYWPSSSVISTARSNGRALPLNEMRSAVRDLPKALTDVR